MAWRSGGAGEAEGNRAPAGREGEPVYLLGDLLALARASWVRRMAAAVAERGYPGYLSTDAVLVRILRRGPVAIGRIGAALGVTRQAARKLVDGLARRGFAAGSRDAQDARVIKVGLTPAGAAYAEAVADAVLAVNRAVAARVGAESLTVVDGVLRSLLEDDETLAALARRIPPP